MMSRIDILTPRSLSPTSRLELTAAPSPGVRVPPPPPPPPPPSRTPPRGTTATVLEGRWTPASPCALRTRQKYSRPASTSAWHSACNDHPVSVLELKYISTAVK